jgi:predicted Zn finger-like uncharacterized protein
MNVSCPHCSARFRVADEKLTGKNVSLRCARCRKVFPVVSPKTGLPESATKEGYVLVAHSDPALCQTIGELLAQHQVAFKVANDGETALAVMDRKAPQVAIVDVALPGMYAFEVVGKVRSRPGLEDVKIILLSSVYNKMAYKCRPKSLYEADDYIEKHHLTDQLIPKIRQFSAPAFSGPAAGTPGPGDAAETPNDWGDVNECIRQAEAQEVNCNDLSNAIEKARRLARIIVSDIALYNQDRIEEGIKSGRFHDLFAAEIAEGKKIFAERVIPAIIQQEDFLMNAFAEFIESRRRELTG